MITFLFVHMGLSDIKNPMTQIKKFAVIFIILAFYYQPQQQRQIYIRADFRLASSQCETSLQSNAVSHWLGANLESTCISSVQRRTRYNGVLDDYIKRSVSRQYI